MRPTCCRATFFFAGLLLTVATVEAQTPLGQPTFDEQKVQVWCATARFVYEDNGRPNLKSALRCGGSLKGFENSIRADSQRVFSALYQPLEGRSAIYKGLGSNPARLQKLKTEIISRLKSSAARRASPARMQRLATLEVALTNYVQNGTPIGSQAEEALAETPDTTAAADEAAAVTPADAGLEEAGIVRPTESARGAGESLMNKFFGPLALIMSLLSLVLYALMRRNMSVFQKELSARMAQRQDEIMAAHSTPTVPATPDAPLQHLSPELQREVERLVRQYVAGEQTRQELPAAPAPAALAAPATQLPPTVAPAVAPPVAAVAFAAPAVPAAPETIETLQIPESPAPPAAPVPAETPPALAEEPGPPPMLPTASPEGFDSLVPPVQLPTALSDSVSSTRYGKAPVDGVFQDADFTEEPQAGSVYEIFLDPQWPELATFQVSAEPTVQAYLLQNAPPDLLAEACAYEPPTNPVTRITTQEEGILRKVAGAWHIEQKALVRFEE